MDRMASFPTTRFPGAMFDQNYRGNFNRNPSGDNQFQPQFQRPPNSPFRPFQAPETFMTGNFQKPPFSNFPDPTATNVLRNRPPPPSHVFCPQMPPPNQMFRMNRPPATDQLFQLNTPPPDQMFRINTPPPNQMFRMNPPPSPDVFRMNVPPPDQSFRAPTQVPRPGFGGTPFDRPFRPWNTMTSFRSSSRPPFQNKSQQESSYQHKDLPLQANQKLEQGVREFRSSSRFPFQNRSRPQASSYQKKDFPLQANKKPKQKVREFRKLKSWMTDELFTEVKKKNALYLKAKSSDEQTAWQEFRLQRNRVSSLIKEAKIKAGLITRKIKEENNTEKPFSCDTCDRAFTTENELKDHLSQHIKCDLGNCTFEAHPKIVALHKRMQHETGYADRISRLQDDAEIKKWREDRRKRFPTAENIKKRQAEQAEKEARGEVLETKEFGKFKRRPEGNGNLMRNRRPNRGRGSFRRHDRTRGYRHYQIPQANTVNLESDSDSDSDSHIKLKKFLGIQSLTNSVSEKCDPIEDTSNPHAPNTANESISFENLAEQNLSKPDSDHVSYADNSSSSPALDETSFVLNNERVNDVTLPADESVCEIPEREIECVKQIHKVVTIEDSDDEGPISVPIEMSLDDDGGDNQEIQENCVISDISCEGSETPIKRKGNENEDECQKNMEEHVDQNICNRADSDDEGPISVPIQMSLDDDGCDNQEDECQKNMEEPVNRNISNREDSDNESPTSIPIQRSANGDYSHDADKEGPEVAPIVKSVENSITEENGRIEDKSCESSEMSNKRKREGNDENCHKRPNRENFKQNGFNAQKPFFQARKTSLLEKLLADDIRHERNVVLQCMRHIVNKDFFGMNNKKT